MLSTSLAPQAQDSTEVAIRIYEKSQKDLALCLAACKFGDSFCYYRCQDGYTAAIQGPLALFSEDENYSYDNDEYSKSIEIYQRAADTYQVCVDTCFNELAISDPFGYSSCT